jgi:hypothetical protein
MVINIMSRRYQNYNIWYVLFIPELTKMLVTCFRLSIHSCGFGQEIEEFGRCDDIVNSIVESVWVSM